MIKIYSYAARMFLGIVLVSAVLVRVFAPQLAARANFPPAAQAWLDVMKATGYLQTLLYLTEFIGGGQNVNKVATAIHLRFDINGT